MSPTDLCRCVSIRRARRSMATLQARPGDVQALKGLAGAKLGSQQVKLVSAENVKASAPSAFANNTVALTTPSGVQLSEPNVIAKYLAGKASVPADAAAQREVEQWLEWEACTLRPATYLSAASGAARDAAPLTAALAHLAAALKGKQWLVGGAITVADVAVYCTLLPLEAAVDKADVLVAAYTARVGAHAAVAAARTQLEESGDAGATAAAFNADTNAYVAARPKLPQPGKRNILITSALPYVNNVPHLGNIIGCVLSADCYARFCRARGYNTVYVCGTDEYGTATETKALEEGLTCAQICDKYHAIHKAIYEWFDIGFDRFGRTPTRWQTNICQSIFKQLEEADCLVEQSMEQLYSEKLGKFLADRFVTGTCPKCRYEDARGDQCDACGNLLNPTELINPKCKITGTTPVLRTTRHVFLDLPKLSPKLQEYINTASGLGGWSSNCVQVTNAWMRDGLKYRCITRDLKWGTPVPRPGYEDKVFYVWFDAPIGYISITANYTPQWEKWWKNPEDVEMVQFMGKDNVPFHTVIFPATLLGTNDNWTLMRNISVTEYLNYEGGKFSKSRGTGVFGNDAKDTGIPCEVWRYYLLSCRPEQQDADFKWSDLQARNNSELLANLGNFINRALQFVVKFFDGKVPGAHPTKGAEALAELGKAVGPKVEEYFGALEKVKLREGIRLAMLISADGNKFLQDTKPWVVVKEDPEHCGSIVTAAVGMVRLLAALVAPYMPSLSAKVLAQLALPPSAADLNDDLIKGAAAPHTLAPPAGHAIGTPAPLVSAIPDETIEALRARFGGSQAEREAKADAAAGAKGAAPAAKGGAAAAAKAKGGAAAAAGAKAEKGGKEGASKEEKGKKEAGVKKEGGAKKEPEAERAVDVSRLDIRVGLIKKAWRHPDAESLYIEEIDVGEEAPRQVVSGLVKYIPEAEMQGRRVLVLCNLKPANMRGVQSQAMVLAATSADGATVELVEPPEGVPPGERVTFEGFPGEPDEQLAPKKKIFETVQPEFATTAERVAVWRGVPFTTSKGVCTVRSVAGGSIK